MAGPLPVFGRSKGGESCDCPEEESAEKTRQHRLETSFFAACFSHLYLILLQDGSQDSHQRRERLRLKRSVRKYDPTELPQGHLHWAQLRVSLTVVLLRARDQANMSFSDHITELNNARPKQPFFFLKPPSSILLPSEGPVLRPRGVNMHFEVELGLVMGKRLRDLDEADEKGAMSAISSKL